MYTLALRWTFVATKVGGWVGASMTAVSHFALALMFSFVAGALLEFSLREKVPGGDYLRFWPFVGGAVVYTVLIIVSDTFH